MEALRDGLWQFIGAMIAFLALATTVIIAVFQRERRRLEFALESAVPLVTLGDDDVRERVTILFDGKPLEDVFLLVLRVRNAGNRPIRPNDFITPLRFRFGDDVRVLEVRLLEAVPSNLGVTAVADNDSVVVSSLLLNRRDFFRLKIFVSGAPIVTPDARIVGVGVIEEARRRTFLAGTMVMSVLSGVVLVFTAELGDASQQSVLHTVIRELGTAFVVAGIVSFLYEWAQHASAIDRLVKKNKIGRLTSR